MRLGTVAQYGFFSEKPPPKWGGVCEARWGERLEEAIEGKTPTEAGRCLREGALWVVTIGRKTPTEAGRCLREGALWVVTIGRKTPTGVGPPSPTKFSMSCPHYSTKLASCGSQNKPPARARGGRQARG